jgi:hypothetical protein
MGLGGSNISNFGQPKPGLPVLWGSAAWVQTQLTPGVSALAAPRSIIRAWIQSTNFHLDGKRYTKL